MGMLGTRESQIRSSLRRCRGSDIHLRQSDAWSRKLHAWRRDVDRSRRHQCEARRRLGRGESMSRAANCQFTQEALAEGQAMAVHRRALLPSGRAALADRVIDERLVRAVPAISRPRHSLATLLTPAAMVSLGGGLGRGERVKPSAPSASAVQLSNEELFRRMQCMEQRIRVLEGQLKSQAAAPNAGTDVPADNTQPEAAGPPKPFPMRTVRVRGGDAKAKTPSKQEGAETAPSATPPAVPPSKPAAVASAATDPCAPQPNAPSPSTRVAKSAPPTPARTPPPLRPPTPAATAPSPQPPLLPPLPGEPAESTPGPTARPGVIPPAPGTKPILGRLDSPVPGLSIGAYGEIKFGSFQNPAANGPWQNGFDAHRLVLLQTYAITPNIIFNAEIEFEHGGIAFDSDDKLHGSVDVEQLFVDFLIIDQLNWRAPGIDLIPIGYINQHHEPT